jgi:hypothetical protein
MIPEGTKDTIPIGSKVFITAEAREKLKGEEPNQALEATS